MKEDAWIEIHVSSDSKQENLKLEMNSTKFYEVHSFQTECKMPPDDVVCNQGCQMTILRKIIWGILGELIGANQRSEEFTKKERKD